MRDRPARARLPVGLAVAAALLIAPAATAGNPIEERLKEGVAVELVKKLADAKVRTVGVLKFRVQKGKEQPTFAAGPMNVVVATMVENALLMQNADLDGGEPPLEVIKDAGRVVAGLKERVSYLTPDGRDRLFALEYPLAWGDKMVKPDGFVTGLVRIDPDRSKATVVVELIDRKTRKPTELTRFDVRATRAILNDVCDSFAVGKARIHKAGPDDLDREVTVLTLGVLSLEETPGTADKPAADKTAAEKNVPEKAGPAGDKPADKPVPVVRVPAPEDNPLRLEVLYDGRPQRISTRSTGDGENAFQIPEPEAGQEVAFRLKNRWDEPIAVALAVNGKNTLHLEDVTLLPAIRLTKWVLNPGEEITVRGYHPRGGKECELFKVLTTEASAKEELDPNPRLGGVQVFVFAQGKVGDEADDAEEGMRRAIDTDGLKSAKEATDRAARRIGKTITPAGLIARSGEVVPAEVQRVRFANPVEVYSQVLWYYDRKNKP